MSAGPVHAGDTGMVHQLGYPIDVWQRASEHSDELMREFALIREDGSDHVPARLLALVEELRGRFGAFTAGPMDALQAAADRGDTTIDLHYEVPPTVRDAAFQLDRLLDEADAFCRAGELLTLATDPESLAFRRWFLEEFVRQLDGLPARPWSEVVTDPVRG